MEEANFLTRFGARVTVIHRRHEFRASKIMSERLLANPKVRVLWDSAVTEVAGDGKTVDRVLVKNLKTQIVSEEPCAGFFVAIGHEPNTALFKTILPVNKEGYLKFKAASSMTTIDGVFAAGDVHDHVYRQAVTAAGAGCRAAIDCERWLAHEHRSG